MSKWQKWWNYMKIAVQSWTLTGLSIGKYTTFEQRLSSFSGIIFQEILDNHWKCFVEFPSAKIQYWKCEVKYSEGFFQKVQKVSFKKSEASNPLIINIIFWFFRLIFSIQKNQKSKKEQIVYSRKTWRRILKSCWSVDWFFFKFCPFREGDLFFREGVFHTTLPFQLLIFSKAKNQIKKSEIGIVNQRVRVFWFFEGYFCCLI